MNQKNQPEPRAVQPTFVRFSREAWEALEDLRYHQQRRERRPVTKVELLEEAVRLLVAARAGSNK